jgi:hypothetical protein
MAVVSLHHQYEEDGMVYTITVILTIILSSVITTVSVPLMWRNRNKWRPIVLPWVWDPLTSLSSLPPPPLGTIKNPIIISNDEDDIESSLSRPSYHEAWLTFTTPSLQLLHCQDCTDRWHFYFDCHQYICDHCLMNPPHHQVSNCPNRWSRWLQSVKQKRQPDWGLNPGPSRHIPDALTTELSGLIS